MVTLIICILFFAICFLWLIKVNINKSRKYKQTIKIRNRIAQDLHDDVGATLSSISFYTEAAKQRIKFDKKEESLEILDEVGISARNTIESMSDIVWMVNPANDSFENLYLKIEDYAKKMGAANQVLVHFNSNINNINKIDLLKRRDIYLICKEAINNAIKYSGGTKILVGFSIVKNELHIIIKDNGKGFEMDKVKQGNGLLNMKVRSAEIGAELNIRSTLNEGTELELIIPTHQLNN